MNLADWRVLVVEDEIDSMELVQGLLEHYGIQSYGVSTAEAALSYVNQATPTLVIIDLALPGLDGWGLLKRLKKMPALNSVPCVAITAYHTAELATKAVEQGFHAYFPKPLDATSFVRELEGIVAEF